MKIFLELLDIACYNNIVKEKWKKGEKAMEHLKVKAKQVNAPNKFHLEVQKTIRMNIFRDRKKYTRKRKHKNKEEE